MNDYLFKPELTCPEVDRFLHCYFLLDCDSATNIMSEYYKLIAASVADDGIKRLAVFFIAFR